MNKKGFATSTIVFALLSVFLISISILLVTITNTNRTKNALNENVVNNIEYGKSSINDIEQRLSELENMANNILDKMYPVGSIYISVDDDTIEKVQKRFGGTWERYAEGTALVSTGTYTDSNGNINSYAKNSQGGSNNVTLTTNNLPAHTHNVTAKGTVSSTFTGTAVTSSGISADHQHYFSATTSSTGIQYALGNLQYLANGNTYPDFRYTGSGTAGGHTHTVSGWTGGASSNHTHIVTAAGTVSSTFTGASATTSSVGSGSAINVQNPYTSVYMYKRTK